MSARPGRAVDTNPRDNLNVSVVILTMNSARTIARCLRSVIRERPGEILAVDGQSTDGTLEMLKHYRVNVLVERERSLGYCRQMGVQAAKGTYVMFVDSDVELSFGCIGTLRRELEEHGWVGICARPLSAENVSYWQRAEDEKFRREFNTIGPTDRIDTMAALFRRDILISYPFDHSLRESHEDVDLCRRLVGGKYRLGVSSAIVHHYHRLDLRSFVGQRFRGGLGRARFGVKYGEIRVFVDPLRGTIYQIVRDTCTGNLWLIPYWVVGGTAGFLGVVIGVSRLCSETGEGSMLPA